MSETKTNPLTIPLFRILWIATVTSNIGTSMHEAGGQWLMTSLSPSPLMVSLILTVTALPIVILAIPSGALADILDRRKLLIVTQFLMMIVAGIFAILTFYEIITPEMLLILTFVLGLGAAINMPSMIGMSLALAGTSDKQTAISFGGIGINIGRAVGPAVAGILIVFAGPWIVFLLNACTFTGIMAVLFYLRKDPRDRDPFPEHVIGAMRNGLKYVRHSPKVHSVLVRDGAFAFFGSAIFALLPLLSRRELELNSDGFGMLLGFFGVGAILSGFFVLPKIQKKISLDGIVLTGSILTAIVMFTLATQHEFILLLAVMIVSGIAQIFVMASLNFAAYKSTPKWVGLRILSVHVLIFQASITIGSIVWGTLAQLYGIPTALVISGIGILAGLIVMLKFKLPAKNDDELVPSMHWSIPQISQEINLDDGPVLVEIQYNVESKNSNYFYNEIQKLKEIRLRDGSINWHLFHDLEVPERYVESFIVSSWAEHMRQHERITVDDKKIQDKVNTFHTGDDPPVVSHMIAQRDHQHEN